MSFANQFMSQLRLAEIHKAGKKLENKVYDISSEQDQEIAGVKLATMGMKIADPAGLLQWLAKDRCLVTFADGKDIQAKRAALEAIVREWIWQL